MSVTRQSVERQRAEQVRAVGAAFFRFRALLVVPSAFLAFVFFVLAELPTQQLLGLSFGFGGFCIFFIAEARRARRRTFGEESLYRSLLVTLTGLALASAMSGGLHSPALPLLFAPTVTTFAAFGRRRESWVALVLCSVLCLGLALLPPGVPFPPIAEPWRGVLALQFTLVAVALLLASVAGLTEAFARAGATLERLREDAVDDAQARLTSVDLLGAKVAHEVKNPLTAVKNLVELVASETADEPSHRRLTVVRHEVDRIEQILHAYLTFARPLEELQLAPVELGELARGVVMVLEVRAERAAVKLSVQGDARLERADARRLRAAIMNVVLNGLEASPAGGTVMVLCGHGDGSAWVRVEDEGAPPTDETLDRATDAFFTSKAQGSGLGLTIARRTVEQHDGTLVLERASGRGTVAILSFPEAPRTEGALSPPPAAGVGRLGADSGHGADVP